MKSKHKNNDGKFTIARENADISYELFCQKYYDIEQPVIIEKAGENWPGRNKWNDTYLRQELLKEPSIRTTELWYWMKRGAMSNDYVTPPIVEKLLDRSDIFPREIDIRIWVHEKGHVSSWHYDGSMVNVFNAQVTGTKEWILVSPDTPLDCYPFSNFGILNDKGDKVLANKIYTKFTLNEGDMLYLPPLWMHKVTSYDDENINLNWVFTKKETTVNSKMLTRDMERYLMQQYFTNHRFKLMNKFHYYLNVMLPSYLRVRWGNDAMIKSPYAGGKLDLFKRLFQELGMIGKTLWHVKKIKPYLNSIKSLKPLKKS